MSKPDGGLAFPLPDQYTPNGDPVYQGGPGMTLRDYFAAHCVSQYLVHYTTPASAEAAYAMADAMIAERGK